MCVCITVVLINGPLKHISGGGFLSESQRKLLEQSCSLFRPSRLPVLESNWLVDTVSKIMDDVTVWNIVLGPNRRMRVSSIERLMPGNVSLLKVHHTNSI